MIGEILSGIYIVGYPVATWMLSRHLHPKTGQHNVRSVLLGGTIALVWPICLAGLIVAYNIDKLD